MEDKNKKETIRVDLHGVDAKKLRYIKHERGFTHNTELVRVLISEEFRRLGGKEEIL